jgi:protocatechuate 3,4-dioxygenase beta subunit
MCENDEFVGRVLSRREVLGMLSATGAMLLIGCSSGDSSSSSPLATSTSANSENTATPTATATSEPTITVSASASEVTSEESGASMATTAPEATATSTAAATATEGQAATATLEAIPVCVVSPELTEGPYFVDENLNRFDIRADPTGGEVKAGVPLELALRVLQVSGDGCLPLEGAQVDVWQCDALGVYSDVQDAGFDTTGQKFLRGYQLTDASGVARFLTIYPGWYQGRTVHIHFKVRSGADDGQSYEFTSQFFFDDALSDLVFEHEPYAAKGARGTRNANDMIYQEAGSQLLLQPEVSDQGYAASFDIGLILA